MKKKEIVIGVISLIVIVGLVWFFGQQKSFIKQPVIEEQNKEEQLISEENINTETTNQSTSDKTVLFNQKMSEAQALFLKKDYQASIKKYNEALILQSNEHVYTGLYFAQLAVGDIGGAEKSIKLAIEKNKASSDYWSWYLTFLHEKKGASRAELDVVYNDGYKNIATERKVNIVTHYARIVESLGDKLGAITLWKKAIELNVSMKNIYQIEIDRLEP